MSDGAWERVPIDAQSVDAPLSRSAIFLVMSAGPGEEDLAGVRDALGAIGDLVKNVGFRDLNGRLSCIVGIGRALWDRLSPGRRPLDLHPFAPIHGPVHTAPSTPGDLLFHIRAEREDMTFEFERQLLDVLGDAAAVVYETRGFRYLPALRPTEADRRRRGNTSGTALDSAEPGGLRIVSCCVRSPRHLAVER
jgi:putative iron-dependent peroxidase